jgi:hypothetical protein
MAVLVAACGGAVGSRSLRPGARQPDSYAGLVDHAVLAHLPALHREIPRTRFVLAAIRDEGSWRRFASVAGFEPGAARVDFAVQIIAVVLTTAGHDVSFYGWIPESDGGVLLVSQDPGEHILVGGTPIVLVVLERARVRRISLGWTDYDAVEQGADCPFAGGGIPETLELERTAIAPAQEGARSWRTMTIASLAATAAVPEGAAVREGAGSGSAEVQLSPDVKLTIERVHSDETIHTDLPEIAEEVASGACAEVAGIPAPTKVVPMFDVTECRPGPGDRRVVKVRADARDRHGYAAFRCTAAFAGTPAANGPRIADIHRVCASLESARPIAACPGLPASLLSREQEHGFVAGRPLSAGWFADQVAWEERRVGAAEALRRARRVRLDVELAEALASASAECAFGSGGRVTVVTRGCEVEFGLDESSRSGPIWRIASVRCS